MSHELWLTRKVPCCKVWTWSQWFAHSTEILNVMYLQWSSQEWSQQVKAICSTTVKHLPDALLSLTQDHNTLSVSKAVSMQHVEPWPAEHDQSAFHTSCLQCSWSLDILHHLLQEVYRIPHLCWAFASLSCERSNGPVRPGIGKSYTLTVNWQVYTVTVNDVR